MPTKTSKRNTAKPAKQPTSPVPADPAVQKPIDPNESAEFAYSKIDDPLLTLTEAAKQLNRHPTTIKNWIDTGALEAVRQPSGLYRIYQSTVDYWKTPNDAASRAKACIRLAMINAQKAGDLELAEKLAKISR